MSDSAPELIPVATNKSGMKLILVVEDDPDIGIFLVQAIHQETDHRAIHHSTAYLALEAIKSFTPHLFILDYNLPDMNGLALYDQLQTFDHLKDSHTILISAYSPSLAEIRKRDILFIRKPFELMKLLNAIEDALA